MRTPNKRQEIQITQNKLPTYMKLLRRKKGSSFSVVVIFVAASKQYNYLYWIFQQADKTPAKMSSIEYSIREEGQSKIHIIEWEVPKKILIDKKNQEVIRPEISNVIGDCIAPDSRFQVKMQIVDKLNDLIGIYYLSPSPTQVEKYVVSVLNYKIPINENGRKEEFFGELDKKVVKNYTSLISNTVEANKWQRLCFYVNFPYHWQGDVLRLRIKFIVKL